MQKVAQIKILFVTPYRNSFWRSGIYKPVTPFYFSRDGHQVDYFTSDGLPYDIRTRLLKPFVGIPAATALKYERIKRDNYDLVIANGEFAFGINHPRIICLFHGSYLGFRNYLEPYLSMRQYVSLSHYALIQRAAARRKVCGGRLEFIGISSMAQGIDVSKVIENGIDTDRFHPGRPKI